MPGLRLLTEKLRRNLTPTLAASFGSVGLIYTAKLADAFGGIPETNAR